MFPLTVLFCPYASLKGYAFLLFTSRSYFRQYFRVAKYERLTTKTMLFKQKTIDLVAETVEGIVVGASVKRSDMEASILIFHPQKKGDSPLVEIVMIESPKRAKLLVQSPIGIVELSDVTEVRVSKATREVAFFDKASGGKVTMLTVSSYGVIQVYSNVSPKLTKKDITEISGENLRAAIAMKIFSERPKKK